MQQDPHWEAFLKRADIGWAIGQRVIARGRLMQARTAEASIRLRHATKALQSLEALLNKAKNAGP